MKPMRPLARVCAFVLSLLVGLELMAAQLLQPPTLMPTEKVGLAYLRELHETQRPLLTRQAERIRSRQEADDAVYGLAGYLRERAEAFRKLPMEPLSPAQATERFQRLRNAEAKLMQSDVAAAFRREDERLRAANFYHSPTLRALWECCAAGTPQDTSSRKDSEMTLLALDAFDSVGYRGNSDRYSSPVAPAAPKLRGTQALFEDCFCPRYCFGAEATPAPKALNGEPAAWAESSASELLALTPQTARALPALQEECRTEYDTFFCYRLTPPFRSTYLVIIFSKDDEHPASFVFSDSATAPHPRQRTYRVRQR